MFEVRVTISAPELAQAINNLAAALIGVKPQQAAPAPQQTAAPVPQPQAAPVQAPAPMPQQTAPAQTPQQMQGYAPANPTPAAPSAATAQTGAPVAPQAGPTSAYPSNPTAPAAYPGQSPMPQQPAQPTGVPVTAPPQYTIDQIMKAGATLMDAGRVDDLMNLLHSFGVAAVTELKPEQTGAFATALRGLGAKI